MSGQPRDRGGATVVLVVLFAGAFCMGCAEMLVMGMLDLISSDLDVSVPQAGRLVTAYALGTAVGGPVLALLTAAMDRRAVLRLAGTVFVGFNLLPVMVADYSLFLVARVAVGAAQGLFIAGAMTAAAAVASAGRAGRAMGLVIAGFAAASAFGLPLGTLLGQALGWRSAFAAVVILGFAVLVAVHLLVPAVPAAHDGLARDQVRHAFAPRVLALLALFVLVFAAVQSALTYLVPYLRTVTDVSGPAVVVFLLAFGVATTVGSAVGSRFADDHATRSLVVGTGGLTLSLVAMSWGGGRLTIAALAVFGVGLFAMGLAPALQQRVMVLAGPGAAVAASLPGAAGNAGDAVGSLVGGFAIEHAGIPAAVLTAAVLAAAATVLATLVGRLRPEQPLTDAAPGTGPHLTSTGAGPEAGTH